MPAVERDERVEKRVVGLVRQLAIEALAVADAHGTGGMGRAHERVAERGLSRAVFARDEDEPPRRRTHRIEGIGERRELGPAIDEDRRARLGDALNAAGGGRLRHVGDERVAAAGRGLDERGMPRPVAERLADFAHQHLDVVRLHVRVRPDG